MDQVKQEQVKNIKKCYQCEEDLTGRKVFVGGLINGRLVIFCGKCRNIGIGILKKKCDRRNNKKNGVKLMWSLIKLKER